MLIQDAQLICKVPAKWVLTGEHTVLKGVPAIALPLHDFSLSIKWIKDNSKSSIQIEPKEQSDLIHTLIRVLEGIIPIEFQCGQNNGTFILENTIPLQAGLGSSAALCVGLVHFLTRHLSVETQNQILDLKVKWATQLEGFFHGKSSGMDVAAVISDAPIRFKINEGYVKLPVKLLPKFTFHNTFETFSTQKCIKHVKGFERDNPLKAQKLSTEMFEASANAEKGLILFSDGQIERSEEMLSSAMNAALHCFRGWGLITDRINQKIIELREQNPLAIKLTGAGLGGFLVALWRQKS